MSEHTLSSFTNFRIQPYLDTKADPNPALVDNCYVGVEVEAEGIDAHTMLSRHEQLLDPYWNIIRDGSLRGPSFEAVLRTPLAGSELIEALTALEKACDDPGRGRVVEFNGRTSTHVHVNVTDLTLDQINKLFCVYLLFEDLLFNYVGTSRANNNYCTRLVGDRTSEAMIQSLSSPVSSMIKERILDKLPICGYYSNGDSGVTYELSKYSALNMRTMYTLGTMEFRHHQGDSDAATLISWINLLLSMKKWAVESPTSAEDLPAYLSGRGAESMGYEVFGNLFESLKCEGTDRSVYTGVRIIQKALLGLRNVAVPYDICSKEESLGGRAASHYRNEGQEEFGNDLDRMVGMFYEARRAHGDGRLYFEFENVDPAQPF